jgi:hypothetical protein
LPLRGISVLNRNGFHVTSTSKRSAVLAIAVSSLRLPIQHWWEGGSDGRGGGQEEAREARRVPLVRL